MNKTKEWWAIEEDYLKEIEEEERKRIPKSLEEEAMEEEVN